jgi:hypothetical protein
MMHRYVDGIYVMVHTVTAPSDDEWNQHCKELETVHASLRGVLVFTAGGGPTAKQRERLRSSVPSSMPPTAIMTDSVLVRGTIMSINWFVNNPLSAFDHQDLEGALRYIARGGATIDAAKIASTVQVLAKELSVKLPTNWPKFGEPHTE